MKKSEKYDFIYNRIRYLIGVKSGITHLISYNYAKIKDDLNDSWPLEKMLPFDNIIILIKDTLKAFDGFRNKQQKCMKLCFMVSKNIYIMKVFSIHYTLR